MSPGDPQPSVPRWLPHPLVPVRGAARRAALRRLPGQGAVGLGLLLASRDRTPHRRGAIPDDRSLLLHVGRHAVDPPRVAGRADHLPASSTRLGYMGAAIVFAFVPGHRHGDPHVRPASAGPAKPGGHRGHHAGRVPRDPVRHDPAAGAVVDHVRDPHRRAGPPAPGSTPLDLGPHAVLRAVGQPARAVGRRTRRPRRLRGDDPARHDADVAGALVGGRP